MAVNLSPVGGVAAQFLDNNGNVLTGGKIYTYAAGTTTPQASYTSAAGTTAHSNPIILDASGRVPSGEIWLTDGSQYKFVIKTADEVTIGTYENIIGINSNFVNFATAEEVQIATAGQTVFTLTTMQYQPGTNNLVVYVDGVNQVEGGSYSYVETNSTTVTFTSGLHVGAVVKFVSAEVLSTNVTDASTTVYTPAGSGAVVTNVQAKLRETVSVKDFGAVGDGVTDDAAAYLNAAASGATEIYVPNGTFYTSLAPEDFENKLSGPGFTIFGGDYAPHRVNEFSYVKSAAPTFSVPGDPAQAMSGNLVGNAGIARQVYIDGPNTAGNPTTGYAPVRSDLAASNLNLVFNSGHNESLSNADGRTGVPLYSSYVLHVGQGDVFNYLAGGYVNTQSPQPTTHWLADPALTVLAGGLSSTVDGANLVVAEVQITDNAKEITASGYTAHLYRTAPIPVPNTKEYVWQGFNINSRGGIPIDSMFQGTGPSRVGLDFSAASFTDNSTAIALAQNQRINFNSTNSSWIKTSDKTVPGNTSMYYDPSFDRVVFDVEGVPEAFSVYKNYIESKGIVVSNTGATGVSYTAYGNNPIFSIINSALGTEASPTAVTLGGTLGGHAFAGYDGSNFVNASSIYAVVTNTPTANNVAANLYFAVRDNGWASPLVRFVISPDSCTSGQDTLVNLGSASLRWATVYAVTGSINTSDAKEKQQVRSLSDKEKAVAIKLKGAIKAFKFNDAVESKGDGARWHFGVIAQEVKAAFESEGLVAEEYGLFCYDEWQEQPEIKDSEGNIRQEYVAAGNRYGVRYDELLAFIIGAI